MNDLLIKFIDSNSIQQQKWLNESNLDMIIPKYIEIEMHRDVYLRSYNIGILEHTQDTIMIRLLKNDFQIEKRYYTEDFNNSLNRRLQNYITKIINKL
jgi:hypothetical protein